MDYSISFGLITSFNKAEHAVQSYAAGTGAKGAGEPGSQGEYTMTQCAEWILNKIAKYINKTFTGLKCILKGFRICFV